MYTSGRVQKRKPPHKGWVAVLSYKGEDGKWKKKTKTVPARNKTEATRMMNAWWAEMEQAAAKEAGGPSPSAPPSTTLGEWVKKQLDQMEAVKSVDPSTISSYRDYAKHFDPIADLPLDSFTRDDVAEWMAWMNGIYAPATVVKSFVLLKQMFTVAVMEEVLEKNPCDGIKHPKRRNLKQGINALGKDDREHLKWLLDTLEPGPMVIGASIALYTGLRRGEVCGLRWKDVDLKDGVLWVRQNIAVAHGKTYVKEPKNGKDRDVAIPPTLVDLLREWKRDEQAGDVYVIGRGDKYANPTVLGRKWSTFAELHGIRGTEGRKCTFHDLRHTWATAAVAAGVDVKTVASSLGHENADMTLNKYASADPDAKRRAAKVMDSVI